MKTKILIAVLAAGSLAAVCLMPRPEYHFGDIDLTEEFDRAEPLREALVRYGGQAAEDRVGAMFNIKLLDGVLHVEGYPPAGLISNQSTLLGLTVPANTGEVLVYTLPHGHNGAAEKLDTLLHEICHALELQIFGYIIESHGDRFQACAKALGTEPTGTRSGR